MSKRDYLRSVPVDATRRPHQKRTRLFRAFGSEEHRDFASCRGRVGADHITDAGHRSRSVLVSLRSSEVWRDVGASLAEREGQGFESPQLHQTCRSGFVPAVLTQEDGMATLNLFDTALLR